MKLDSELLLQFPDFPWFAHCGRPFTGKPGNFRQIESWAQAESECTSARWRNMTEDALGTLTEYLSSNYLKQYQGIWNKLIREAKPIVEQCAVTKALEIAKANGISNSFIDCVRWDVLGGVMEVSYKSCKPPRFFAQLLEIYKLGHFPCGIDDDGTVVLF